MFRSSRKDAAAQVKPGAGEVVIAPVDGMSAIDPAAWDACAGTDNPFVSHAFLSALEDSGSVRAETGWMPRHLTVRDEQDTLLAVTPLYVKGHSYGEYVFDWSWANAYERAGGRYYPKLQCAVPFTPVTGPRLMLRPDAPNPEGLRRALAAAMITIARESHLSSLHVTFPEEEELAALESVGMMRRLGRQYHWRNEGYGDFEAFLGALSSKRRKVIRAERRKAAETGIRILTLTGSDINERHWDAFFRFYRSTVDKRWGQAYLHRAFFSLIGERMADRIVLIMGEDPGGRLVCGALNLLGDDALYGRNWGAIGHFPMLHFEVCYYRAIDFAIARGLTWVEAGAQGEHKIQRGYMPRATWSAHWIADSGFRDAVADFLHREQEMVAEEMEDLAEMGPFRRTGDGGDAATGSGR